MSPALRVALDVTGAIAGGTGVARYVTELGRALDARDDVEVLRFALGRATGAVPAGAHHLAVPLRVLHASWRALRWPTAERLAGRVDVVHATDLEPPPTRRPLVLTVHDLDALGHPELHGPRAIRLQRRQLEAARTRADAVIAVSSATAATLTDHGVDADRIHVVHHGVSALAVPPAGAAPKPGVAATGPYLLAVATLDARKGLDTLIAAFSSAIGARRGLDGLRLVVAGPDGHRAHDVRAAVAAAGVEERVELPGRVDDARLAALYRGALAFCLPSRAEGFGLPVLEAMAAGAPVLASDLPAVREVAAEAAVLLPAGDVGAWADAITSIAADPERRSRLAEQGRARAAAFTWEAAAAGTAAVYRAVSA